MSATVFAVTIAACIAIFTTAIIFLIRTKSRLQAELAGQRSSTKITQNYDEVLPLSQSNSAAVDTRKNIAYAVHTPNIKNTSNM